MPNAPLALITDADSRLGQAFAHIHAQRQGDMILVTKDSEGLNEFRLELETQHNVQIYLVQLDFGQEGSAELLFDNLEAEGLKPGLLFNNSLTHLYGPLLDQPIERINAQLGQSLLAPLTLTRLLLPGMHRARSGFILTLCGLGRDASRPGELLYTSAQQYLLTFSKMLGAELDGSGIAVAALNMAPAKEGKAMPTPEQVVLKAYKALLRGDPMIVVGGARTKFLQKNTWLKLFSKQRKRPTEPNMQAPDHLREEP